MLVVLFILMYFYSFCDCKFQNSRLYKILFRVPDWPLSRYSDFRAHWNLKYQNWYSVTNKTCKVLKISRCISLETVKKILKAYTLPKQGNYIKAVLNQHVTAFNDPDVLILFQVPTGRKIFSISHINWIL